MMAQFSKTIKLGIFNEIISKSAEDKISLKAAFEISPSYLLNGKKKTA